MNKINSLLLGNNIFSVHTLPHPTSALTLGIVGPMADSSVSNKHKFVLVFLSKMYTYPCNR